MFTIIDQALFKSWAVQKHCIGLHWSRTFWNIQARFLSSQFCQTRKRGKVVNTKRSNVINQTHALQLQTCNYKILKLFIVFVTLNRKWCCLLILGARIDSCGHWGSLRLGIGLPQEPNLGTARKSLPNGMRVRDKEKISKQIDRQKNELTER